MSILGSLRCLFVPRDDDPVQIASTRALHTNAHSRPRLQGSMPYAHSETALSSKAAASSGSSNPKKATRHWLSLYDHMPQDPIQVSDNEGDTETQSKRNYSSQSSRTSATQSTRCNAIIETPSKRRQKRSVEEGILLGDFKQPADAFVIETPRIFSRESSMPKKKFLVGGHRPLNTLDCTPAPVPGSKDHFIDRALGRTATEVQGSKRRNLSLHRNSGPEAKRQRSDGESPDPLQEQGLKPIKLALAAADNLQDSLTSSPMEPLNAQLSHAANPSRNKHQSTKPRTGFRKCDVPWSVHKATDKPARKPALHNEMVISDDNEEDAIKHSVSKRRQRESHNDNVDELGREPQRKDIPRTTISASPTSARQPSSDPSRRIGQLDMIFPDSMLHPQEVHILSPGKKQERGMVSGQGAKASQRPRTTLTDTRSSSLPRKETKDSLGQHSTPTHVKLFRSKRMLFRSAIKDASGYVLAVDKNARTFSIDYASNNLGQDRILPDTSIKRILKVTHGNNGAKVKIETSTIDVIGNEVLIELNSPKLVHDLLMLLQRLGTDVKVTVKEDEWLDRAFDRFDSSSSRLPNRRQSVQQEDPSLESPYFSQTGAERVSEAGTEYAPITGSSIGANGFTSISRSRASDSAVGRRRTMLQKDLEQRPPQLESDQAPDSCEKVVTRHREARYSAMQKSTKPLTTKHPQSAQLGTPWENPLTYPKNGKKRATVNFDDLSRLNQDEFLNDNIIAFFLRYLEYHLEQEHPDIAKRSYFFNSYFYEKLRQNPGDKKNINYEGVKKWTDRIGLFSRDFVVVPVNENLHWYVAIICNLSWFKLSEEEREALDEEQSATTSMTVEEDVETANANNTQRSLQELSLDDREHDSAILISDFLPGSSGKSNGSAKKKGRKRKSEPHLKSVSAHLPAIITLDSLNVPRYNTVAALKQYIAQEAKERINKDIDVSVIQGVSAKKIPMQSNYSDCGLFVCAYLERFAMDPMAFIKQELGRIAQQWPTLESHDLRRRMREFILELHNQQEGKTTGTALPSVGKILLPPAPSRDFVPSHALCEVENGDEKMYKPSTSPALSGKLHLPQKKRHGVREQPSGSEDELMDPRAGLSSRAHHNGDPGSLKARTAKILNSPSPHHGTSFTVPESDHEQETTLTSHPRDDSEVTVRRPRTAKSPKQNRKAESDSVSPYFVNGHESYERTKQRMPDDDHDDEEQEEMLV